MHKNQFQGERGCCKWDFKQAPKTSPASRVPPYSLLALKSSCSIAHFVHNNGGENAIQTDTSISAVCRAVRLLDECRHVVERSTRRVELTDCFYIHETSQRRHFCNGCRWGQPRKTDRQKRVRLPSDMVARPDEDRICFQPGRRVLSNLHNGRRWKARD